VAPVNINVIMVWPILAHFRGDHEEFNFITHTILALIFNAEFSNYPNAISPNKLFKLYNRGIAVNVLVQY